MLLRSYRILVASASLACCRLLGRITLHRIRHFLHHLLVLGGIAGARREGRDIKFRSIPSCAIAAFDSGRRVCLQVALRRYTVLYWCAYPMRGLLIPRSSTVPQRTSVLAWDRPRDSAYPMRGLLIPRSSNATRENGFDSSLHECRRGHRPVPFSLLSALL